MTCSKYENSYLNYMIYFTPASLCSIWKKWVVVALIECYGSIKYTAILRSNKKKIVKIIFHQLQGYLITYFKYFPFIFTLAKFDIYPCDVTSSCVTNLHTNLPYLGLVKTMVAKIIVGTRFLFFNPLMHAGLFKYAWPFCYHQALTG